MNLKITIIPFVLASLCCFVKSAPLSLDEYLYDEFAIRNARSDRTNSLEWPQQNEIRRDGEYAPHEDLNTLLKNELEKFRKKKPMELYKRRIADNRERIDKRNSGGNSNYYMQLCHFKICNIGKKRARAFSQEQTRRI